MTFFYLTKAFDTVSSEVLWKTMVKFGCPGRFNSMVRQVHNRMTAQVLNVGDYSDAFPVSNGVKQDCLLAPTLFGVVFSAMLTDAFWDSDHGVHMKCRTDGQLFNLCRLRLSPMSKRL